MVFNQEQIDWLKNWIEEKLPNISVNFDADHQSEMSEDDYYTFEDISHEDSGTDDLIEEINQFVIDYVFKGGRTKEKIKDKETEEVIYY